MRIWNILEKRFECVLPGHEQIIIRILITSDYKYIISSDRDRKIGIWNLRDRSLEGMFTDLESAKEWSVKYKEIESFFSN